MDDEFGAFYDFIELKSLTKLQNHPDVTQTDFNPFKYKVLYDKIIANVKLLIDE